MCFNHNSDHLQHGLEMKSNKPRPSPSIDPQLLARQPSSLSMLDSESVASVPWSNVNMGLVNDPRSRGCESNAKDLFMSDATSMGFPSPQADDTHSFGNNATHFTPSSDTGSIEQIVSTPSSTTTLPLSDDRGVFDFEVQETFVQRCSTFSGLPLPDPSGIRFDLNTPSSPQDSVTLDVAPHQSHAPAHSHNTHPIQQSKTPTSRNYYGGKSIPCDVIMADVRDGQTVLHACSFKLPYSVREIADHLQTHAARGELWFNLNFCPFRPVHEKPCKTRSKDDAKKENIDLAKLKRVDFIVLVRHIYTQHFVDPPRWRCPYCPRRFRRVNQIKRHRRRDSCGPPLPALRSRTSAFTWAAQ